jgi:hypothetical protein
MNLEKIIPQLSKSKVFIVKLGFAALGIILVCRLHLIRLN